MRDSLVQQMVLAQSEMQRFMKQNFDVMKQSRPEQDGSSRSSVMPLHQLCDQAR